jgi:ferredoxin-type protein NapH
MTAPPAFRTRPGKAAVAEKGWLGAHRWLVLRRVSQFSVLALFLLGPLAGVWIVKGNLASSLLLDTVPMTDPFVFLQVLSAGHWAFSANAAVGAIIVLVFYWLAGGRAYCAWVCPVNLVTDAAAWLRQTLGIQRSARISRQARYWMLAMALVVASATGSLAWELINPVSMFHRGVIFGLGFAWVILAGVFAFDLLLAQRGWCGHVCPMGAFYGLVGHFSPLRVRAGGRGRCNDCAECYAVCPEPQVIRPALKGEKANIGPVIMAGSCTNCGRCIDVCSKSVFAFGTRFHNQVPVHQAKGSAGHA